MLHILRKQDQAEFTCRHDLIVSASRMLGRFRAARAGQQNLCMSAKVATLFMYASMFVLDCLVCAQVLADTIAAVSEAQVAKDDQTAGQHQLCNNAVSACCKQFQLIWYFCPL